MDTDLTPLAKGEDQRGLASVVGNLCNSVRNALIFLVIRENMSKRSTVGSSE